MENVGSGCERGQGLPPAAQLYDYRSMQKIGTVSFHRFLGLMAPKLYVCHFGRGSKDEKWILGTKYQNWARRMWGDHMLYFFRVNLVFRTITGHSQQDVMLSIWCTAISRNILSTTITRYIAGLHSSSILCV